MRAIFLLTITMYFAGCSSVETLDGHTQKPYADNCTVKIFQTRKQAEKLGNIEELCIINGTSSGSFSHTIQTAIEKHKQKACGCGASMAYIESRRETGLEVATVTLIAFRLTP